MFEKLEEVDARYQELGALLCNPEVIGNRDKYLALSKERADLTELVETYREYRKALTQPEENKELLGDPELRDLARQELEADRALIEQLAEKLKVLLLPRDPNDDKNVILEIRAGTGGEEAALFAADLFRMYTRYAERNGWKVEVLSSQPERLGRLQGGDRAHRRRQGLQPAQVRERRAPRAARAGDRGAGPHPHLGRDRGRAARGRGGRRQDRREGPARSTSCAPAGPAARASTPPTPPCASRTCRRASWSLPGREVAAQEQGQGDEDPALAAARGRAGAAGRRAQPRSGARRSAAATAPRRSAPTTSRRTASPTTASA